MSCHQFTAAAKASSALMITMAAFTDLYTEKMGLKEIESIDERVEMTDLNDEREKVTENADDAIEDLVCQHEQNAGDVAAGGLLNLNDLMS
ncbi:hypothetical protein PRK78_004935 [Emydomyces testavorans]|uniref:Uncharacterized protein n=1 Tax=Emydomyces testavorans TaxID=2070801 RepID=A0AAF0DIS5_9EURO|nr:hypothetical protein PRK78_004935 [Emydomyces testavorans]